MADKATIELHLTAQRLCTLICACNEAVAVHLEAEHDAPDAPARQAAGKNVEVFMAAAAELRRAQEAHLARRWPADTHIDIRIGAIEAAA